MDTASVGPPRVGWGVLLRISELALSSDAHLLASASRLLVWVLTGGVGADVLRPGVISLRTLHLADGRGCT